MKKLHIAIIAAAATYLTLLPLVVVELYEHIAVGPGFVDSFTVACGSSATLIASAAGTQISYSCQTPAANESGGTTLIAVGDRLIADPDISTRNSPVYSGSTSREWSGDVIQEYCRADSGTVTIFCRAMVATSAEP